MATTVTSIDTQHEDSIHDVQADYYGRLVATASSDRTVRILDTQTNTVVAELRGHAGPVWQVSWAHPKFGRILASCSYDRKVIIWKELSANQFSKIHEYENHDSSVNSVQFAPHEFGLSLAAASSDGTISVLTFKGEQWDNEKIPQAHQIGVNSVSWAPAIAPGSIVSGSASQTPVKRLVSGGCDNLVKIWRYSEQENAWRLEETLDQHTDWVRDVAWAPNIGLPSNTIASCSQDGTVAIWSQDVNSNKWEKRVLPKFPDVVWRVSWSIAGNILAISTGDNKVSLWKENLENEWKCISQLEDEEVSAQ
eukprot:TRINITY_DN21560_c0_g1_i1.p1 TRINITY_DN21560_c0_g1~~TRINITY_DN21560_c0_g1_i1.p1  ORF type:complete len:308 (-),score=56.73 TRINITY_DN21560_c0_g1_i1:37-960(-)